MATVHAPHFFSPARSRFPLSLLVGSLLCALLAIVVGGYFMGYLQFQLPMAQRDAQVPLSATKPGSGGDAATAAGPLSEGEVPAETAEHGAHSPASDIGFGLEPAVTPDATAASSPAIPELWQLPASLREGIPQLDFSLHVYSTRIDQRSIIINNRMMREGEAVTPQLTLSAITPDGVVMRYRSAYFRVSIVDGW